MLVVLAFFMAAVVSIAAIAANPAAKMPTSAVCPVMGTKIPDVSKAVGKSVYKGKTYYFCCKGCKPAFDKNPAKCVGKPKKTAAAATCPMSGKNGHARMAPRMGHGQCPYVSKSAVSPPPANAAAVKPVSAVCPVMGNKIADVSKAADKSVYKGQTYYFCCKGCKPMFDKDPEQYIKTANK